MFENELAKIVDDLTMEHHAPTSVGKSVLAGTAIWIEAEELVSESNWQYFKDMEFPGESDTAIPPCPPQP